MVNLGAKTAGVVDGGFSSLFADVIGHAPIGVAVIDFDGRYRSVNPAYCRIYGYDEGEMLGRSFTMVFPQADRYEILARHREFLSLGTQLGGEFTVLRRDGEVLKIVTESVRIPGDNDRGLRLVYVVDITAYRRLEDELRTAADTYRTLFETVPQGIIYFDLEGNITTANPAALRILDVELAQLAGRASHDTPWRFIHPDGTPLRADEFPNVRAERTEERVLGVVMGFETGRRGLIWIEVSAVPVFKGGKLDQVYTYFEDITERMLLSRALEQKATTDYLTGTANRATLIERLTAEWERLRRQPDSRSAVLSLDIDFFKQVNDTFGHAAGDAVIKHVPALIAESIRATDLVGRMGGEEFLVLLPNAGINSALRLAKRLCERVASQPANYAGRPIPVTISIGVSVIASTDASIDAVLGRADAALYAAKQAGRNRAVVHPESLPSPAGG